MTPQQDEPVRIGEFYVEDDIAHQWRETLNGMALKTRQTQRRIDMSVAEDHPLQTAQPEIFKVAHELLQLTKTASQLMQHWGQSLRAPKEADSHNDTGPLYCCPTHWG